MIRVGYCVVHLEVPGDVKHKPRRAEGDGGEGYMTSKFHPLQIDWIRLYSVVPVGVAEGEFIWTCLVGPNDLRPPKLSIAELSHFCGLDGLCW